MEEPLISPTSSLGSMGPAVLKTSSLGLMGPAVLHERQTGGKEIEKAFYAEEVAKLVLWLEKKDETDMKSVKMFTGFTENAYRYLFAYEDNFPHVEPELQVILPSGKKENEKKLEPKKEGAIIAYTRSQKMTDKEAAKVLQSKGNPFVFEKNGEPYVMQTWPNKFNAKLKKEYTLHKYPLNPDPEHFEPEALEDFKHIALKLFRQPENENPPLWLGNRKSENDLPMYEGTGDQIMALLRLRQNVREQLRVLKILEPDGFLCKFTRGNGEEGEKPFHMDLGRSYALYTKQGWEKMACVKPVVQFDWEAERHLPEGEIPYYPEDDAAVISFPVDMEWVSGPAYLWTWRAAAVLWSGAVFTVSLSYLFYARAGWWEHGLLTDFWQHVANTFIALVIVSVIAFGLYADNKAMSYCIVPWLQNVERTMIIPFYGPADCDLFQRFSLACTLSQILTIQLNAWVLGNTIRNSNCQIESAWQWLWNESGFGFCPLNLMNSVLLLWGLSALQMVVPASYTLAHLSPFTARTDVHHSPELIMPIDKQSYKQKCGFLLSGSLTEGVTLMALAAGMRYTGAVSLSYPLAMIKRIKTQQMGFRIRNTPEDVWEQTEHGWQFRCVKELEKLYSVQVKRVWFILVFKYACQMNVQVTLFILKGAIHNKVFNYFAAVGELVSLATMLLGIASELFDLNKLLLTFWDIRSSVWECLNTHQGNDGNEHVHARHFFHDDKNENEIKEEMLTFADLKSEYYRILANTVSVVLVVVFAMWLIGYQMLKFLNFWRCPDGLWSFQHGCLALDDLNDFLHGPHGVCQEMQ